MSEVAEHFERMMDRMRSYIQPGPYTTQDGRTVSLRETQETEFIQDMIYLLDGPEQRKASAELAFDYVAETDVTASGMDGRNIVGRTELVIALKEFIIASERLDLFKKALFRGRSREEAGLSEAHNDLQFVSDAWDFADLDLLHGIIGVATESGELAEIAVKYLEGNEEPDDVNVREEIGDVLWYLSRLVKWAGTSFLAEMQRNIAKLRKRHTPTGFNKERDINRDLAAERVVLEGDGIQETVQHADGSETIQPTRAPPTPWPGASPNKANHDEHPRPVPNSFRTLFSPAEQPADPLSSIKDIFDKN
jgi:NTP pyrophosphatase (non-canonical NTP hydrolase)